MTSLVSVIVTTYNRSIFLREALTSIIFQTYNDIELLVIDDGSESSMATENKKICQLFNKCQYFYKENTGQPDSRNFGINRSKGNYIAFCDDDDYWDINKLEKQIEILNLNPDYALVTGCIEYIQENGQKTGNIKCHEGHNHGYIFESLLIKNRTASITPLLRREVFDKVGYFNPSFTIGEDWEFWRRVSYYYKFYSINQVIAYVRLHPENMSKSRSGEVLEFLLLYRKLTKSLLDWGETRFSKEEKNLIEYVEWQTYRKMLVNRYSGILKKIDFIKRVLFNNMRDGCHLIFLILKYEIFNQNKNN